MSDVNIEEVIAKYVELRDAVERKANEYKAAIAPLEVAMKTIESVLMAIAIKTGQTQFGTKAGTAFITTKTGCNVADWSVALPFIINGNTHLLNKAVNKTAVGEYIAAHEGQTPPGINWTVMKEIQVRRPG